VHSRKEGVRICYQLASEQVALLYTALREVASKHLAETEPAAQELLGQDNVEELSRDALWAKVATGEVLLLDVRPENEFGSVHIGGALSIPLDQLPNRCPNCRATWRWSPIAVANTAYSLMRRSGYCAPPAGKRDV
jgi:rhodanese-related sulfurtransferase